MFTSDSLSALSVDITLDSNTANRVLVVSKDGREVRYGGVPQNLPDIPERFDPLLGVLGKEGYSSGAFYFEVSRIFLIPFFCLILLQVTDSAHYSVL